jgi:hypothetical protein
MSLAAPYASLAALGESAMARGVARSQRFAMLLLSTLFASMACNNPSSTPTTQHRRLLFSEFESQTKLPDKRAVFVGFTPPEKLSMRVGGGLIGYLQRDPTATFLIFLQTPRNMAGGAYNPNMPLSLATSSDIVRMTDESEAWHLIGNTGRILSVHVGGLRHVIANLSTRTAFSGCAERDSTIHYLDSLVPGIVFSQRSNGSVSQRDLPREFSHEAQGTWHRTRFGGSAFSPCVLWHPKANTVLIVEPDTIRDVGALVERPPRFAWYTKFKSVVFRRPLPVGVLDATSFEGGVAVLFQGTSPQAGRIVDFYGRTGYVASWVLSDRPLGIAGSRARIYSITVRNDSALYRSYIVPLSLRNAVVDSEPPVFVRRLRSDAVILPDSLPN